ncbi:MAG: ATP-grasp domain-containing protein [Polyangiaceae bacterium]|nr:ATP-grasp domain-containing protein [Polyangiaceae bacterium]
MQSRTPLTFLCLSSYFKGNDFLRACKAEGCRVLLLTVDKLLGEAWPRDAIDEIFAMPGDFSKRQDLLNAVSFVARSRPVDRIVALDDYDVEVAAMLREHLRVGGMGESTARYFRDKLAMRERASTRGVRVPDFVHVLNHERVGEFLRDVPGPWLLKPRSEAGSMGIKTFEREADVWAAIEALGDQQSYHLLERMIPGDVYHVDALVYEREVLFAAAHRYRRPLLGVVQKGGIFGTRTVERNSPEEAELLAFHREVIAALGLVRGASHTEFIRGRDDGKFYFLESGARVGGAHISDLVEASTGVNLWAEWARLEIAGGKDPYAPKPTRDEHAGLLVSLARQERPDTSSYDDPEVCWRLDMPNHVGLVVRSPLPERVEALLDEYERRFAHDFYVHTAPKTV